MGQFTKQQYMISIYIDLMEIFLNGKIDSLEFALMWIHIFHYNNQLSDLTDPVTNKKFGPNTTEKSWKLSNDFFYVCSDFADNKICPDRVFDPKNPVTEKILRKKTQETIKELRKLFPKD